MVAMSKIIMVFIVCFLAITVYMIAYRIKINRALRKGKSQAHNKMAEPRSIAELGALLVFGFMLFSIMGMLEDISQRLKSIDSNAQQVVSLREEISGLRAELLRNEKRENSMLASFIYRFGKADLANGACQIIFQVTPKNHMKDAKLTLSIDETVLELKDIGNGEYEAEYMLPYGQGNYFWNHIIVTVEENGNVTKEELTEETFLEGLADDVKRILFEPDFRGEFDDGECKVEAGKLQLQGNVYFEFPKQTIYSDSIYDYDMGSAGILIMKNGEIEKVVLISEQELSEERVTLNESISVGKNDYVTVWLQIKDCDGYCLRSFMEGMRMDSKGQWNEVIVGEGYGIYSPDGTVVFSIMDE